MRKSKYNIYLCWEGNGVSFELNMDKDEINNLRKLWKKRSMLKINWKDSEEWYDLSKCINLKITPIK